MTLRGMHQQPVNYIEGEVWKPVNGYEGFYEVSNLGRVKSLPRLSTPGGLIKPDVNKKNGYAHVCLSKGGKAKRFRVHRVVVEAFSNYRSGEDPMLCIDHIDGDKTNNKLENLEVVTIKENTRRAHINGRVKEKGVQCIDLDTLIVYRSFIKASRACGGNSSVLVRKVCDGEYSHYHGHRFARYEDYVNGTIPNYKGKYKRRCLKKYEVTAKDK